MRNLKNKNIIVAGGTGNVGAFLVAGLLEKGATVVVPSRSQGKLDDMQAFLAGQVSDEGLGRLHTVTGNITDETSGPALVQEIIDKVGAIHGSLSSLGRWHQVGSLLEASKSDFDKVLDGYFLAHLAGLRHLVPALRASNGTHIFINGPLAFQTWGTETALVSIATAAQHMLFRALAKELEGGPVNLIEVVTYAYIRNRETQPGSPLSGEDLGAFVATLYAGDPREKHGETLHLRSKHQVGQPEEVDAS